MRRQYVALHQIHCSIRIRIKMRNMSVSCESSRLSDRYSIKIRKSVGQVGRWNRPRYVIVWWSEATPADVWSLLRPPTSERSNRDDVVEPLRGSILLGVRGAEGVASLHPRLQKVRPLLKSHDGAFLGSYVALCKRFILPGVNNWQCPLFHCAISIYSDRYNIVGGPFRSFG